MGDDDTVVAANSDRDGAIQELIRLAAGQRAPPEQARDELVCRLLPRSNDYEATARLTLVNAALAEIGWPDAFTWEARTWRIPR
jgi:hypothetical protein